MDPQIDIGIIGGSGLYDMEALTDVREVKLDTPFGAPSDSYIIGTLSGVRAAFLPRHGRGHRFTPSEVNYRANIYGFKKLDVRRILSVTAVGSLRENIHPLDIVVPDQFFDRTRNRAGTFFGDGLVAHIAFAQPVCPQLTELIRESSVRVGASIHVGGTLVCIEGPAFSTQAESITYRNWGMDIVGMTSLPEAKLAREAEICYAPMAMVTDYDSWHEENTEVTVEMVVENLGRNISVAKNIIGALIPSVPMARNCACGSALQNAIMTEIGKIPADTKARLGPLVDKYIK